MVDIAMNIVSLSQREFNEGGQRRSRLGNRVRNRQHGLNEMESLSELEFKRMFRMTKHSFNNLEELIENHVRIRDIHQARRSSQSTITTRTRLACCLRWMAGGSYIDICFEFGVAPGSFFHEDGILWETML
jgi:hypothetical protein